MTRTGHPIAEAACITVGMYTRIGVEEREDGWWAVAIEGTIRKLYGIAEGPHPTRSEAEYAARVIERGDNYTF